MTVRSVRLPVDLWARLERVQEEINTRRPRKIGVSSIIRALLTAGLANPGGALDFDSKVYRPKSVTAARAAQLREVQLRERGRVLWTEASAIIDAKGMAPGTFAQQLGGVRIEAERFYANGDLPENILEFVERVQAWLAARQGGDTSRNGP